MMIRYYFIVKPELKLVTNIQVISAKMFVVAILFLIISLIMFIPTAAFANNDFSIKKYNINSKKKIATTIGAGKLNRIHIDFAEIMEVVGDESKYSIHWSGDYRNLFIFPKVAVGETIEISFLMSGGIAQDVIFTVADSDSRTISFHNNKALIDIATLKYEISTMMNAMLIGDVNKYYVIDMKRIISKNNNYLIKEEKTYRFKNLTGSVLSITNRSKNIIKIEETEIRRIFHNPIAINIIQQIIQPKQSIQILIINKKGDDNV